MALTDNLVAYWKMEGNSNSSTGVGNGTDTSISYSLANGKIFQGGGFNGTTSKSSVGGLGIATGKTAFSISCWVNPTVLANGPDFNSQKQMINIGGDGMYLIQNQTQDWRFGFHGTDGNYHEAVSNTGYTAGVWRFLLGTYDGTTGILYVDGINKATFSYTGSAAPLNTANGFLGTPDGSARFLNGGLDEIAVWQRTLSPDEALTLNSGGVGNTFPFTPPFLASAGVGK